MPPTWAVADMRLPLLLTLLAGCSSAAGSVTHINPAGQATSEPFQVLPAAAEAVTIEWLPLPPGASARPDVTLQCRQDLSLTWDAPTTDSLIGIIQVVPEGGCGASPLPGGLSVAPCRAHKARVSFDQPGRYYFAHPDPARCKESSLALAVVVLEGPQCSGTASGGSGGDGDGRPANRKIDASACPCASEGAPLAPVCGADGITYGSACLAGCAGVGVRYPAACEDPAGCAAVLCTAEYVPVCAVSGTTHPNRCMADCVGAAVVHEGECGAAEGMPGSGNGLNGHDNNSDNDNDNVGGGSGYSGGGQGYGHGGVHETLPCPCSKEYRPVCGCDGITYNNPCLAACAGTEVLHEGPCEDPAGCAAVLCPAGAAQAAVCGVNGKTYGSECLAACSGITPAHEGPCGPEECARARCPFQPDPECACPAIWAPVCGADGRTYASTCVAACARAIVVRDGECGGGDGGGGPDPVPEPPCACPFVYLPVCGCDGVSYDNACAAECAGTTVLHEGACADAAGCAAVTCPADVPPVCGVDGDEYTGHCVADCSGIAVAHEGVCRPEERREARCPPPLPPHPHPEEEGEEEEEEEPFPFGICRGPVARCFADPCSLRPACLSSPAARCYANGCGGARYRGARIRMCGAAYILPGSGALVPECSDVVAEEEEGVPEPEGQGQQQQQQQGRPEPEQGVCVCTMEYAPVCGCDGREYGNACAARCAGAAVLHRGPCARTDGCDAVRCAEGGGPVCGADGLLYGSRCLAACAGIEVAHEGPCWPEECRAARCAATQQQQQLQPAPFDPFGGRCESGVVSACRADPCSLRPSCPENPAARCYANACAGARYSGVAIAPCGAAYIDPGTGALHTACSDVDGSLSSSRCGCAPLERAPVCGCDGVTYGSACEAGCAGAVALHEGACADPAGCDAVRCAGGDGPACGADGATYPSACLAACTGVALAHPGACLPHEQREARCDADAAGGGGEGGPLLHPVRVVPLGPLLRPLAEAGLTGGGGGALQEGPREDQAGCAAVACPAVYAPVCGANGRTYSNDCLAKCASVRVASRGECGSQSGLVLPFKEQLPPAIGDGAGCPGPGPSATHTAAGSGSAYSLYGGGAEPAAAAAAVCGRSYRQAQLHCLLGGGALVGWGGDGSDEATAAVKLLCSATRCWLRRPGASGRSGGSSSDRSRGREAMDTTIEQAQQLAVNAAAAGLLSGTVTHTGSSGSGSGSSDAGPVTRPELGRGSHIGAAAALEPGSKGSGALAVGSSGGGDDESSCVVYDPALKGPVQGVSCQQSLAWVCTGGPGGGSSSSGGGGSSSGGDEDGNGDGGSRGKGNEEGGR